MSVKQFARKKKFIRRDIQLQIVFMNVFVACLVLLLCFLLNLMSINSLASNKIVMTVAQTAIKFQQMVFQNYFIATVLTLILSAAAGVYFSFRFCGPIYRFELHLRELCDGRWDKPCRIRKDDNLQDFCKVLNEATAKFVDHAEKSHDALTEAGAILDELADKAGGALSERIENLRAQIAAENSVYQHRMGPMGASDGAEASETVAEASGEAPAPAPAKPAGSSESDESSKSSESETQGQDVEEPATETQQA